MTEENKDVSHAVAREAGGLFKKGVSGNPSGVSKIKAEHKKWCEELVTSDEVRDQFLTDLLSPGTRPETRLAMMEFLASQAFGKPGIRKEDQGLTPEVLENIMPKFVYVTAPPAAEPSADDVG